MARGRVRILKFFGPCVSTRVDLHFQLGHTIGKNFLFTKQQCFGLDQNQSMCTHQIKVAKSLISAGDREENNEVKGENIGDQHFLLFPQCFQKLSLSRSLKVGIVQ